MTTRTLRRQLASVTAMVLLAACLMAGAEARTYKINTSDPTGSPDEVMLNRFKEVVGEKTNGEIDIRVFMDAQLGGPQESLESLKTGTLEFYGGDFTYYATLMPEPLGVVTLMYFFQNNAHLQRYLRSDYFKKQHQEKLIEGHGIRFLSTEFNGFKGPYRVFVSTKPVMGVQDVEGLKMRLWPNDVIIRQWRHLGAVPTVMEWQEVYLALRQGTIDAVTGPLTVVEPTRFTEVAPYVTELKQFPQVVSIAVSERVWQTFTPEQQQILIDAANQVTAEYGELVQSSGEAAKREMMQRDGAVFIQVDTEPFREKMIPFYETLIQEGDIDKEAFDTANALR